MGWYELTNTVETFLEDKFESLGRSVTRKPLLWFVSTLILSFGCMAGVVTMTSKSAIVDLWVPADSEAKVNYDYIDKVFTTSTNDVNVIFTAPNGEDNILKSTCLTFFGRLTPSSGPSLSISKGQPTRMRICA